MYKKTYKIKPLEYSHEHPSGPPKKLIHYPKTNLFLSNRINEYLKTLLMCYSFNVCPFSRYYFLALILNENSRSA